jgi:hypothetical protein
LLRNARNKNTMRLSRNWKGSIKLYIRKMGFDDVN